MARKKRDYKAEYARRNKLAKERGFKSYNAQRKAIETGNYPAVAPWRLRTRRTLDAQSRLGFGFRQPNEMRIDAAKAWSDRNARTNTMKFDEKLARKNDRYLSAYLGATIMMTGATSMDESTLIDSPDLRELLVEILKIYDIEEYDGKYKNGD